MDETAAEPERIEMPEELRRAIEAQGRIDADEIAAAAAVLDLDDDQEEGDAEVAPKIHCSVCGDEIDTGVATYYRRVEGWEKVRDVGGANAIVLRQEKGTVACHLCIERMKAGTLGQGALL